MLECKWINFCEEEEKVLAIEDKEEQKICLELLEEIIDKINSYNQREEAYLYLQKRKEIIERGVIFTEIENVKGLRAKWSKIFAHEISPQVKKEIYYQSFKWHIFCYEKVNALTRKKARAAFDKYEKSIAFIFYEHSDKAFLAENAHLLKSNDFDMDYDIYIFNPIEKWTYVHTHETVQCGPYFYQIKNQNE